MRTRFLQEKDMTETKTFISFDALAAKRAARLAAKKPIIKANSKEKRPEKKE